MNVGIIYHENCLKHRPGGRHPERPERLQSIVSNLESISSKFKSVSWFTPPKGQLDHVLLVHTKEHIDKIKFKEELGGDYADDLDTIVNQGTLEAALYAVGASIHAGNLVLKQEVKHAIALIRPPGHHATVDKALGFCIFNNIAILAKWLLKRGLKHIAIIDWDAHHGNGTQDIFYDTSNVLYVGLHQDGRTLYPGTGSINEIGQGNGLGYTINIPFPPRASEKHYIFAFKKIILPYLNLYQPDIMLVSAGYDAHYLDNISDLFLTAQSYWRFSKMLMDAFPDVSIILLLEGGYNLQALSRSVANTVLALDGQPLAFKDNLPPFDDKIINRYMTSLIKKIRKILDPYWRKKQ